LKIFVRERTRSKKGSGSPRYRLIANEGGGLQFLAERLRKVDIETIAKELGAHIVYLPEREHSGEKN
jgi:hypothetical protein